mmetsp:Transcript_360/g.652  ORF Transcript_360/g.652 Transcript_360/m.652 type:complete len:313 (+) Transcript_360:286-1224(+)
MREPFSLPDLEYTSDDQSTIHSDTDELTNTSYASLMNLSSGSSNLFRSSGMITPTHGGGAQEFFYDSNISDTSYTKYQICEKICEEDYGQGTYFGKYVLSDCDSSISMSSASSAKINFYNTGFLHDLAALDRRTRKVDEKKNPFMERRDVDDGIAIFIHGEQFSDEENDDNNGVNDKVTIVPSGRFQKRRLRKKPYVQSSRPVYDADHGSMTSSSHSTNSSSFRILDFLKSLFSRKNNLKQINSSGSTLSSRTTSSGLSPPKSSKKRKSGWFSSAMCCSTSQVIEPEVGDIATQRRNFKKKKPHHQSLVKIG